MAITRGQVLHVARLARLDLGDDEVERLTGELDAILEAVSTGAGVDLLDGPAASPPPAPRPPLAAAGAGDEPLESLPIDDVLRNAPAAERDLFRVPPTA